MQKNYFQEKLGKEVFLHASTMEKFCCAFKCLSEASHCSGVQIFLRLPLVERGRSPRRREMEE